MADDKPVLSLPALDPATVPARTGSGYPEPFRRAVAGRSKQILGDALGLKNFGVNLVRLPPGVMSSIRHWHARQDEFVIVLEGELALVTDAGAQTLRTGMVAGFPAGRPDGHHLVNRSTQDAVYLEVGDRTPGDSAAYPDDDLVATHAGSTYVFTHKNGERY
ncbi:MAG: cupin domain-containing protein [Rhodospirillales bacterium]|nr:cupin domain-containing protein [Rhodospirillales bacterium]